MQHIKEGNMSTFLKVLLVIMVILVIALVALYFYGKKLQKKQAAAQEQMEAAKQSVRLMAIDKKMLPIGKAGLPEIAMAQTNWLTRRSKVPVVKAKVDLPTGSRVMNMIADNAAYEKIPLKKEVRAIISGLYIMDVKGIRGPLETPPKKQSLWQKAKAKVTGAAKAPVQETPAKKDTSAKGSSRKNGK